MKEITGEQTKKIYDEIHKKVIEVLKAKTAEYSKTDHTDIVLSIAITLHMECCMALGALNRLGKLESLKLHNDLYEELENSLAAAIKARDERN